MTKDELVEAVAADAGITKRQATAAIDAVRDHIIAALVGGETVAWPGFATFAARRRAPHRVRDLHTGALTEVPETARLVARQSAAVKRRLAETVGAGVRVGRRHAA